MYLLHGGLRLGDDYIMLYLCVAYMTVVLRWLSWPPVFYKSWRYLYEDALLGWIAILVWNC